jgi:hypothetical protein
MHALTYQVEAESLFEIDFVKDKGLSEPHSTIKSLLQQP